MKSRLSKLIMGTAVVASLSACSVLPFPLPWDKPAPSAPTTSYEQPQGGKARPTAGTTLSPDKAGAGNGRFPFQPGAISVDEFIEKLTPANEQITTLHYRMTTQTTGKNPTDTMVRDVDIDQSDLERIKALGSFKTDNGQGFVTDETNMVIGPRWWSYYREQDQWLIMQGDLRTQFNTSKYFFDGLSDSDYAVAGAWYLGMDGGSHKVQLAMQPKYYSRELWNFIASDVMVTMWFDDELRVVKYSYQTQSGDSATTTTHEQSDFGKPVSIQPPK